MSLRHNRNFLILTSGQWVSMTGTSLFMIALPWLVYAQTNSKALLALMGLILSIPNVLGLWAGVWVDRWPKRRTMIGVDLIRGLLSLLIALLAFSHVSIMWWIAPVLLLQIAGTLFTPAQMALMGQIIATDEIPAAMGISQSGTAAAQLAGQAGGGAVLTLLGAPILFLTNALSFGVSMWTLSRLNVSDLVPVNPSPAFWAEWRQGWNTVWHEPYLRHLITVAVVVNGALAPFMVTVTAWVRDDLHQNAAWLGLLAACFLLGLLFGGIALGPLSVHWTPSAILWRGLSITGAAVGVIGFAPNRWVALGLMTVSGMGTGIVNGSLSATLLATLTPQVRGRVMGLMSGLSTLIIPIGLGILGPVMTQVSLPAMFALMGGLIVLAAAVFILHEKCADIKS